MLDCDFYFPPFVLFCIFLFVIIYWTDFLLIYSLFLSSNLLILVVCPYPLLCSWVLVSPGFAYGIFIASSAGLRFSFLQLFCFGFTYLLIIYYIFFPLSFSHFAHVDVFMCFATTSVRISSLMEHPSSKVHWLPHYWEPITSPTLPYIDFVLGQLAIFLDSWPLRMGPIGCPETSVRNYQYLLCNNPEERSSQPSCHWTNFHEIWHLSIFQKSVKIKLWLIYDKNNGYFTGRSMYIFDNISLNSLRMRNVLDKSRGNQNTHFVFNNFFLKIVPFMR